MKSKYAKLALGMIFTAAAMANDPGVLEEDEERRTEREKRAKENPERVYLPEPSKPFKRAKKLSRKKRKQLRK